MRIEYMFNPDDSFYIFFIDNIGNNAMFKTNDNLLYSNFYNVDREKVIEYLEAVGLEVKRVV